MTPPLCTTDPEPDITTLLVRPRRTTPETEQLRAQVLERDRRLAENEQRRSRPDLETEPEAKP